MAEILSNNSIVKNAIEQQLNNEQTVEEEKLDFNPLRVYFGDDYVVNDRIIIHQPSIQDFIDADNESDIYHVIAPFVSNTTGYRVQLWDMGIDWNKISNLELFSMLIKTIDFKYSQLIFGDINFSTFNLYEKTVDDNKVLTLYSPKMDLEIDEETMNKICKYKKNELREVGYFEFMYNIQRLQIYESTRALFGGMYSGMCDLSKVDPKEFNFMRDVKVTA